MIPIEECKDGYLYAIHARNGSYGIYNEKDKTFTLSRVKFNLKYLDSESHWDTTEYVGSIKFMGTAKPTKEIEVAPTFKDDNEKLAYLDRFENRPAARLPIER